MRFVVIGTSGCGKSTFARRLAAVTRSPHIELDSLYWLENWTARPDAEFAEAVQNAAQNERWVADGNYSKVRDVLWPRATHIIWLNFSRQVVFSRVLRRTARRTLLRERLWQGNRESLRALFSRDSILLWSWTTFASNRSRYGALRGGPEYRHLSWVEFTSTRQAETYLTDLTAGPSQTHPSPALAGDVVCEPQ
jgi:adenylate kinase family enzyme